MWTSLLVRCATLYCRLGILSCTFFSTPLPWLTVLFSFKLRESHKCQWRASWANFWWMHTVFQALCWVYVEESLKTRKEIQHNTYSQTKETESIYSVLKCFSSKDFLWKHSSKNCINEDSSNNSNKMSNEKKIMTYGEQENVSVLGIAINETS